MPGGHLTHGSLVMVALDVSGVDDEIRILQGRSAIGRALETQVCTPLGCVADSELVNHLQPFLVDIHEADPAAGQALRQTEVFDQTKRELRASRSDDADFDGSSHIQPPFKVIVASQATQTAPIATGWGGVLVSSGGSDD